MEKDNSTLSSYAKKALLALSIASAPVVGWAAGRYGCISDAYKNPETKEPYHFFDGSGVRDDVDCEVNPGRVLQLREAYNIVQPKNLIFGYNTRWDNAYWFQEKDGAYQLIAVRKGILNPPAVSTGTAAGTSKITYVLDPVSNTYVQAGSVKPAWSTRPTPQPAEAAKPAPEHVAAPAATEGGGAKPAKVSRFKRFFGYGKTEAAAQQVGAQPVASAAGGEPYAMHGSSAPTGVDVSSSAASGSAALPSAEALAASVDESSGAPKTAYLTSSPKLYAPSDVYGDDSLRFDFAKLTGGDLQRVLGIVRVGNGKHTFSAEGLRYKEKDKAENNFSNAGAYYGLDADRVLARLGFRYTFNDLHRTTQGATDVSVQDLNMQQLAGTVNLEGRKNRLAVTLQGSQKKSKDKTKTSVRNFPIDVDTEVNADEQGYFGALNLPLGRSVLGVFDRELRSRVHADLRTRNGAAVTAKTILDRYITAAQRGLTYQLFLDRLNFYGEAVNNSANVPLVTRWDGNSFLVLRGAHGEGVALYGGTNDLRKEAGFLVAIKDGSVIADYMKARWDILRKDVTLSDLQRRMVLQDNVLEMASKTPFFWASYDQTEQARDTDGVSGGLAGRIGPLDLAIYGTGGQQTRRGTGLARLNLGNDWSAGAAIESQHTPSGKSQSVRVFGAKRFGGTSRRVGKGRD